jgi:argininosuccinate lyase
VEPGDTEPIEPGPIALGEGSRLTAPPSALAATTAYQHELDGIDVLFADLDLADMAHLLELVEVGLVDRPTAGVVARGLLELRAAGPDAVDWDPVAGDVYNNRTRHLRATVGEQVDVIHTGRARREATTLAWHLAARRAVVDVAEATAGLTAELVAATRREAGTIAPDFTYLQRAHPTSLGHYLCGFAWPLVRDLERLAGALDHADTSPAGSGSVNGSALPLDRRRMAARLGFAQPVAHTRDAMWQADLAVELAAAATSPLVTVGRLADDLFVWSSPEFGYFVNADEHCRNSVIMPQKRNPYALAYLRGRSRAVIGPLTSVLATQFTPTGQPDSRTTAYVEVPRALAETSRAIALMAEIIERGDFDRERLAAAAASEHAYATDYCDLLTLRFGVPNGQAHRVLGRAIRSAVDAGRPFVSSADLDVAERDLGVTMPRLDEDDLARLRDPAAIVETRTTLGGAAPPAITEMCEQLDREVAAHVDRIGDARRRFAAAERSVVDETSRLAGS